ncbi:MAG: hypothetical protein ACYS80_16535, partial [Planctomycetota bacterium]
GSIFVMGITGMTEDIHLKVIMSVLLGMVLLYTALGGMVSVVVLDYIQFVVLSFSLLATSLLSIRYLGWGNIIETVSRVKGQAGFNPFSRRRLRCFLRSVDVLPRFGQLRGLADGCDSCLFGGKYTHC